MRLYWRMPVDAGEQLTTRCRPLLGTFVEITVPESFGTAVDAAFAVIAHIHDRMSFHEPTSDLAALRRAAPGQTVAVDRETVAVMRMAIALYNTTDGLFDVAVAPKLVRSGFLPKDGIRRLEQFDGTIADIVIEDDSHIHLKRPVMLDLGGIAKGHAVDRAVETLTERHVPFGLVNAGGDLRAFGPVDWQIRFRDADNITRSQITIRDCAVASSANLLDRRLLRGVLHTPHIGRNGQPVLSDERTTVIAERCMVADAMTKIAMVDPELADQLLASFKGQVVREIVPLESA